MTAMTDKIGMTSDENCRFIVTNTLLVQHAPFNKKYIHDTLLDKFKLLPDNIYHIIDSVVENLLQNGYLSEFGTLYNVTNRH